MDAESATSIIDRYEAGSDALSRWIAGMTREQLLATPVAGTWSMQQLVIHMLESELAAVHRMRRIVAEELPLLIAYDETLAAKNLSYEMTDAVQAAQLFQMLRAFATAWLRTLDSAAFSRQGVHNQRGKVSLAAMITLYAQHGEHHATFASAKRVALGLPPV
jgi:uncharacterized damage-inducible protein DinB